MARVALRPIDQLTRDWEALARSASSRTALIRLAAAEPEVHATGARDLGQLVAGLQPGSPGREPERAAAVFRAMLRSQSVHPLVPRAALQAVLPGLVTVARRLAWGSGGDWEDGGVFFVDVVTTAWEVIVAWAGDDREYAVLDLLSAVRCRLRRQLLGHRASTKRVLSVGDPSVLPARAGDGGSGPEDLARVIDDLDGRGMERDDAAVMYAHRVLGYTLTDLATMTGRSRRYLGDRRDRAVKALTA